MVAQRDQGSPEAICFIPPHPLPFFQLRSFRRLADGSTNLLARATCLRFVVPRSSQGLLGLSSGSGRGVVAALLTSASIRPDLPPPPLPAPTRVSPGGCRGGCSGGMGALSGATQRRLRGLAAGSCLALPNWVWAAHDPETLARDVAVAASPLLPAALAKVSQGRGTMPFTFVCSTPSVAL